MDGVQVQLFSVCNASFVQNWEPGVDQSGRFTRQKSLTAPEGAVRAGESEAISWTTKIGHPLFLQASA